MSSPRISEPKEAVAALLYPANPIRSIFDAIMAHERSLARTEFLLAIRENAEEFRINTLKNLQDVIQEIDIRDALGLRLQQLKDKETELSCAMSSGLTTDAIQAVTKSYDVSLRPQIIKEMNEKLGTVLGSVTENYREQNIQVAESAYQVCKSLSASCLLSEQQKEAIMQLVAVHQKDSLVQAMDEISNLHFSLQTLSGTYFSLIERAEREAESQYEIVKEEARSLLSSSLEGSYARLLIEVVHESAKEQLEYLHTEERADIYLRYIEKKIAPLIDSLSITELSRSLQTFTADKALMESLEPIDEALWQSLIGIALAIEQQRHRIDAVSEGAVWLEKKDVIIAENFPIEIVERRGQRLSEVLSGTKEIVFSAEFFQNLLSMTDAAFDSYIELMTQLHGLNAEGIIALNDPSLQVKLELKEELGEFLKLLSDPTEKEKRRFENISGVLLPKVQELINDNQITLSDAALKVYVFGFLVPAQHPEGISINEVAMGIPGVSRRIVKQSFINLQNIGLLVQGETKEIFRLSETDAAAAIHKAILATVRPGEELQAYVPKSVPSAEPTEAIELIPTSLAEELEEFLNHRQNVIGLLVAQAVLVVSTSSTKDIRLVDAVCKCAEELFGSDLQTQRQKVSAMIKSVFPRFPLMSIAAKDVTPYYNACEQVFKKYNLSVAANVEALLARIDEEGGYQQEKNLLSQLQEFHRDPIGYIEKMLQKPHDQRFAKKYPNIFSMNNEVMFIGLHGAALEVVE